MEFNVEIMRTIATTIEVEAKTAEEAVNIVYQPDYELPLREEWSDLDDWVYVVYDKEFNELYRTDG
jgi:hypothetical protein